jgi:hypothetical protein
MKPKRDEKQGDIKGHKGHKTERDHGSGTLIANLQALLSIAKSLEIFHSLRSLLTDSSINDKNTDTKMTMYTKYWICLPYTLDRLVQLDSTYGCNCHIDHLSQLY